MLKTTETRMSVGVDKLLWIASKLENGIKWLICLSCFPYWEWPCPQKAQKQSGKHKSKKAVPFWGTQVASIKWQIFQSIFSFPIWPKVTLIHHNVKHPHQSKDCHSLVSLLDQMRLSSSTQYTNHISSFHVVFVILVRLFVSTWSLC